MLDNILELKDKFDLFIFDIYGVIWDGKKVIPNSIETLEQLKADGKKVVLMSNSTLTSDKLAESYEKRGFLGGTHYDDIVSSGDVAYMVFSQDPRPLKYYQFGKPSPALFVDSHYIEVATPEEADFIYIGVPQVSHEGEWFDVLEIAPFAPALQKLRTLNKTLVCANPDLKAHEKSFPQAVIRQGSIAQYYKDLGGDVAYFGKPYSNIFDYAIGEEAISKDKILMIGDTFGTDILGANDYGIKSALTLTGISVEDMQAEGVESIEAYAEKLGIIPTYFVKSI